MTGTSTIRRFASELPLPFSKVVQAGDFLFLSGQMAMRAPDGTPLPDIESQTEAVLSAIAQALQQHGASMSDVVKATVWLADLAEFQRFNRVYEQHFRGALPARSTVRADLVNGARIEIEVQAFAAGEGGAANTAP